jgi:cobalt-zinc-cadmium efflux system outer membrane protein
MKARLVSGVIATLMSSVAALAQPPAQGAGAEKYFDPHNGLTLEQAIARALEHEPSLRAVRTDIDAARGRRLQASLRPNPSLSFERRQEPGGTDNQTTVGVQWPLELFRRTPRVAVADRELAAMQLAVADRERLLAADVRMRYGETLAATRNLTLLDELVKATERQHALLQSRVDEGAAAPLERDLLTVELRRLQSDRALQAGRTEAALVALKPLLGMRADADLTLSDALDDVVRRESGPLPTPRESAAGLSERTDVREAGARIDIADARIERARAESRVDVSLFANYMRMDAGFPQRGLAPDGSLERVRGLFHYASAGAMVTLPVLNRNQGELAAARAERAGAAAAYDAARLTADAELAAARTRDDHARQAVTAYAAEARTLARQNLTVVSQSYDLGRVTVFDVLAEQRRYLDVERAYTEALEAAFEARTALTRALGGVR